MVLGKSTWAVLALTCLIELFTQEHYRKSIEPGVESVPLWKDVFLFHWKEESQHAILDELEWMRENTKLTAEQRDAAVDDLIALAGAVDQMLQAQAKSDAEYSAACKRSFAPGKSPPRSTRRSWRPTGTSTSSRGFRTSASARSSAE